MDSLMQIALGRLMDAARLLFKIVRLLIQSITKIVQAATNKGGPLIEAVR